MAFNNNDTTSAAVPHKPTMGEKISGTVDSLIGKATHNPTKVAEGEAKKTGEPLHGVHAGASEAIHGNNHGSGLTGNNNHGSGLTGNNHNSNSGVLGSNHDNHNSGGILGGNHNSNTHSGGLTGNNHSGAGLTGNNHSSNSGILGGNNHNSNSGVLGGNHNSHTGTGLAGSSHTGGLTGSHNDHYAGEHTHGAPLVGGAHTGQHHDSALGHHSHSTTGAGGLTGAGSHNNHGTHGADHTHGAHVADHTHGAHGADHHNKPTIGEKISGGMESMVGKATSNPAKVHEGEVKRTHDPMHAQAAAANVGTDSYGNHQTGALAPGQPGSHTAGGLGQNAQTGSGAFHNNPNTVGNNNTGAFHNNPNTVGNNNTGAFDNTNTGNRY